MGPGEIPRRQLRRESPDVIVFSFDVDYTLMDNDTGELLDAIETRAKALA